MFVYTIRLEGDALHPVYYYVGTTDRPDERITDHIKGLGTEWTRLHKPTHKEYERVEDAGDDDERARLLEEMTTIALMCKHGMGAVRGGPHCKIILDANTEKHLTRSIRHATDTCMHCGGKHMLGACDMRHGKPTSMCSKCSRFGHTGRKCPGLVD